MIGPTLSKRQSMPLGLQFMPRSLTERQDKTYTQRTDESVGRRGLDGSFDTRRRPPEASPIHTTAGSACQKQTRVHCGSGLRGRVKSRLTVRHATITYRKTRDRKIESGDEDVKGSGGGVVLSLTMDGQGCRS